MESDGFNDRVDIPLGSNLCMQKSKDQVCKYDVLDVHFFFQFLSIIFINKPPTILIIIENFLPLSPNVRSVIVK